MGRLYVRWIEVKRDRMEREERESKAQSLALFPVFLIQADEASGKGTGTIEVTKDRRKTSGEGGIKDSWMT